MRLMVPSEGAQSCPAHGRWWSCDSDFRVTCRTPYWKEKRALCLAEAKMNFEKVPLLLRGPSRHSDCVPTLK